MKDGTKIRLDYKSSETPWSSIREWFPTIEERQLEHFIEKGIDNKLITLFNKLCSIENKIDSLSIKKKDISLAFDDDDENLPFK